MEGVCKYTDAPNENVSLVERISFKVRTPLLFMTLWTILCTLSLLFDAKIGMGGGEINSIENAEALKTAKIKKEKEMLVLQIESRSKNITLSMRHTNHLYIFAYNIIEMGNR